MISDESINNVVWQGEHAVRPYIGGVGANRVFARLRAKFRQDIPIKI
jgi:hypothetical protein